MNNVNGETAMIEEIENQEIETSLLLLGTAYAMSFVAVIVWLSGQVGI